MLAKSKEVKRPTIYLEPAFHKEIRKLAIDYDISFKNLAILGLKIMKVLLEAKTIPKDLAELLQKHDPKTLKALQELINRKR